jgi:hypothetical protein
MLRLVLVTILIILCKFIWLYYNAKTKHRLEWLDLFWFCGKKFGKTGIKLPRAFMPIFSCFEKRYMGLNFRGVRIIISTKDLQEFLVCKMEKKRCFNNIIYDVGVGGMIPSSHTSNITCHEELFEELGIQSDIKYIDTLTPSNNCHCIVDIYSVIVDKNTKFNSSDGTFISFEWMNKEKIFNNKKLIRNDGFIIVNNF